MLRVLCLGILVLPSAVSAQKQLHYSFKPGEHVQYHYKVSSTLDVMRKKGERESVTTLEADPDWRITDVDMDGAATIVVTIPNREEDHRERMRHINASHLTPQSRIVLDARGQLQYGKILIDDAPRTKTKELLDKIPGLNLLPEKDILREHMSWIWFILDTLPLDTLGTETISRFDTVVHGQNEKDTVTFGRNDRLRTAYHFSYHHVGTSRYSLRDTVADGFHFWRLRILTDAEEKHGSHTSTYHRESNVLLRKKDGLIYRLRATWENHNGNSVNNSETDLDLKSVEGD